MSQSPGVSAEESQAGAAAEGGHELKRVEIEAKIELDRARLLFDERKFDREAALRKLEIEVRDREVSLKDAELKRTALTNPLTVAVAAGMLSLLASIWSNHVQGRNSLALERQKFSQTEEAEQLRRESQLVLAAVKTGDTGKNATNLKFLIEAKLVRDPESIILNALTKNQPDFPTATGPVSFLPSTALTPDIKKQIEARVEPFKAYLKGLGANTEPPPRLALQHDLTKTEGASAFFNPSDRTIRIDSQYAGDPDIILREFMHGVLLKGPGDLAGPESLESGLASYFPCSFNGKPLFAPSFESGISLRNQSTIKELKPHHTGFTLEPIQIWGGVFWDLRETLKNVAVVDGLLLKTWFQLTKRNQAIPFAEIPAQFKAALLALDQELHSGRYTPQILEVLGRRGF